MLRLAVSAAALVISASTVFAGGAIPPPSRQLPSLTVTPDIERPRLIGRDTAIKGCLKRLEQFDEGRYVKWIEQNEDELGDIAEQLRNDKLPNWKELLMGAAISICMPHKGYYNKCIADDGNVDGDLQVIETARIPSCWVKGKRAQAPSPPPVEVPCEPWNQLCRQPPPPPPPVANLLSPPPMSPADLAQFREDMAIIMSPPTSIYPYGNQGERFASCASHWQATLHYNRPPQVRQVLVAVRVARCMYRTGFGFFQSGCSQEFPSMLNPGCYARFG